MSRTNPDSVLVVASEAARREVVAGALRRAGHLVRTAADAAEAIEAVEAEPVAAIVADADAAPGGPRIASLVHSRFPDVVILVLAADPTAPGTALLLREGAFQVLPRAVPEEVLDMALARALDYGSLRRGNRDLKSQLDLSEKLAMIGRLASGVAHELNNPLDGVRRYVRLTKEGLETEERDLAEYLDRAMSGLSRMTSIVRQLLTFSRNIVLENEVENLRSMLGEVVRTMAPTGSAAPAIVLENPFVDIQVPKVLHQVFANLLRNALDAVECRGARGRISIEVHRGDAGVSVSVADNGCGIAPENLRRVFEPFFTTKEVGKGTGLGLPISARIVERCGGTLRLESDLGVGTAFTVTLPLPAAVVAASPAVQENRT